ncbi:MAG: hypothetical protein GYB32_03075 [Algicola sp.]|nr:hypothetical protein [Algicola sp.]
MTTYSNTKPPMWFWIVSVIILIWNLLGVMAYLSMHFMTEEMISKMEPQQQFEMNYDYPAWYIAIFAIAVFAGTLACIGLLMRKKWAYTLFIISFLCATVQQVYYVIEIEGVSKIMPLTIIAVCALQVWFSKSAIRKAWIK